MPARPISKRKLLGLEAKKTKRLSSINWAMIRFLWEAKKGTFKELGLQFNIPENTIKKHSMNGKWQAGAMISIVEEAIKEDTTAMLARLGMPKEKFIKLVVAGAIRTNGLKNVKRAATNKSGEVIQYAGKPVVIEQTVDVIDQGIMLEYRREVAKLAGWYAAPRAPVDGDGKDLPPVPTIVTVVGEKPRELVESLIAGKGRELISNDSKNDERLQPKP